jgi:chromosome partitioning protein
LNHDRVGVRKIKAVLNSQAPADRPAADDGRADAVPEGELPADRAAYHPLLIRIGDGPGDFASMPRRSAIAEAQAHGQVLWEMKKTAAREAAKDRAHPASLARIVAGQPQTRQPGGEP